MNDNQLKKDYRSAMDMQKVPVDLVRGTIEKMHQERSRMIGQATEKASAFSRRRTFVLGGAAAAAAALVCVFSLAQNNALQMNPFTWQPDLRIDMAFRAPGGAESQTDPESLFASQADGFTRSDCQYHEFALDADAAALWVASASYENEKGASLQVTLTSFATTAHQTLMTGQASRIGTTDVFAGQDSASGDLFAVWQKDGCYVQLRLTGGAGPEQLSSLLRGWTERLR